MDPLAYHETSKCRAAIFHVTKLYPGVVGEVLAQDITDYIEFGYRFDNGSPIPRLVTEIMTSSLPH